MRLDVYYIMVSTVFDCMSFPSDSHDNQNVCSTSSSQQCTKLTKSHRQAPK